jgi:hypothetical protein
MLGLKGESNLGNHKSNLGNHPDQFSWTVPVLVQKSHILGNHSVHPKDREVKDYRMKKDAYYEREEDGVEGVSEGQDSGPRRRVFDRT